MALTASTIKLLQSLSRRRERASAGVLLAEGTRLVWEALDAGASIQAAYYTEEVHRSCGELVGKLKRAAGETALITPRELGRVSDVVTSQGILALVRWGSVAPSVLLASDAGDALLVACDGLSDPGNMGSLLRTCAWFGVEGVLLGAGCVDVTNPKVVRGSMGAIFRLSVAQETDLPAALSEARGAGFHVYGADASAPQRYDRLDFHRRSVVVLGNEAHGLSPAVRDRIDLLMSIPRYGNAESLNVAVACGIILASAASRRKGT